MSAIPRHIQRRVEQRRASKFSTPTLQNASKQTGSKPMPSRLPAYWDARKTNNEKTRRLETAGLLNFSRREFSDVRDRDSLVRIG
jgi:hypothetical protein